MKKTIKRLCMLTAVCISASSASALTLNLNALIEGRFNGTSMISDQITVELHSNIAPFALVETKTGTLTSTGGATLNFNTNGSGPYFIAVKHRNSIETWSATAISPVAGVMTYDFTTANTQAYGNNLKLKSGKYCIFSGDVNQDGKVDATDETLVMNDADIFATGYLVTDLTGDLVVEGTDYSIVYSNKSLNVIAVKPGVSTPMTLKLTALIEGFYNGTTMVSDDILVELHNSAAPYALVASANSTLNTSGKATITFTGASINSNYYIVIKHRNSIETWSAPVNFVTSTISYDFTTAASKAYGSNLKLIGGKACIYSGDVNQDGKVDATDVTLVYNDADIFAKGYIVTDITGNMVVEGTDYSIAYTNKVTNKSVKRPGIPATLNLNLTALIEGFYNGSTMVSEPITVELRSSTTPYGKVATSIATLSAAGTTVVTFTGATMGGNYYVVVKHRNSMETWSAAPVTFTSSASYDFTTAASKAYGNNMKLKGGKYCFYSGDVNQDGKVDATDVTLVYNETENFTQGHILTDLTGNMVVEGTDYSIVYTNKTINVIVKRPSGAKSMSFGPIESANVQVNTDYSVSSYPNPMIGNELNFNVTAHENDLITITLHDIQGRKVADIKTDVVATDGSNVINSNIDLNPGMYFYRVSINNDSFSGKLIKE